MIRMDFSFEIVYAEFIFSILFNLSINKNESPKCVYALNFRSAAFNYFFYMGSWDWVIYVNMAVWSSPGQLV